MGRPLYSTSFTFPATTSAVQSDVSIRTDPDVVPDHPDIRKWSYWNAFDPDADEFFDGPNAVYEAFVDPSTLPPLREEIAVEEAEEALRAMRRSAEMRIGLVTPLSPAPPSLSSEDNASGRTSPASAALEEPYVIHLDHIERAEESQLANDSEDEAAGDTAATPVASLPPPPVIRRVLTLPADVELARPVTPPRPSTPPPSVTTMTPLMYTPSPPPTVTPRLFTWAPRNAYPASPLPNRSARMSVAHISPAYVPPVIISRVRG